MRRIIRLLGVAGVIGLGTPSGFAQSLPANPPPPPSPATGLPDPSLATPAGMADLAGRMAREVRQLGADVGNDLGGTPRGQLLGNDARELAQAADEFRNTAATSPDRFTVRQSYSGFDSSYHYLVGQLGQPGAASPAVEASLGRVAQTDALLHRAIGMNDHPAGYFGPRRPLIGMADMQRLTQSLHDRAEALAAASYAEMRGVGGTRVIQDAVQLANQCDVYHDALNLNGKVDGLMQRGFSGVAAISDRLGTEIAEVPPTPRVASAWQAYRAAEVLVRQTLGLPNAPMALNGTILAPQLTGVGSPIGGLTDRLLAQLNDFLNVFGPDAGAVPEGGLFLQDAQTLQAAAAQFRDEVVKGPDPARLAYDFRDVDAVWQRLARRTNRIARGRSGPNVRKIEAIGQTLAEVHRLLGIPGYPPALLGLN